MVEARPLTRRSAGILLHPTSLPSPYGIGDFGPSAEAFIDFLSRSGQRVWQVLPLGLTDAVASPYAPPSAMAGNWLLVSPEELWRDGFLPERPPEWSVPNSPVHYRDVERRKRRLLEQAFVRFTTTPRAAWRQDLERFQHRERQWLEDAALFFALKRHFGVRRPWTQWPVSIRRRRKTALRMWRRDLREEIRFQVFLQWQFDRQWRRIRRLAAARGILVLGDVPHFVVRDSVDTWADPQNYLLDHLGRPRLVAGVPPDYFSPRGQVWGNPLYDWDHLRDDGYRWWRHRLSRCFRLYDAVRLDHFRGYVSVWGVRSGAKTARGGRWHRVPGEEMLRVMTRAFPAGTFVAEDLGDVSPDVVEARNRLGFPGVRVVQFGFDDLGSIHYLKNLSRRSIAYTGTHDNNTTRGWFTDDAHERERQHAQQAVHFSDLRRVAWSMTKVLYRSRANTVIVPLQDVLNLGSEARMNTPGTRTGNWRWRYSQDALTGQIAARLRRLVDRTGRGS